MGPALVILILVIVVPLIWAFATYNRFVRLKNHLAESWSDIDVELKRRYELIPNLVATVKGYAAHEKDVLERVTQLRAQAMSPHVATTALARDESALSQGLKDLFVVAENYPQLKADKSFLALQHELALTEDRIAAARRFYNGNVRELKSLCEMFPSSLITGNYKAPEFFQLDSDAERAVPTVGV